MGVYMEKYFKKGEGLVNENMIYQHEQDVLLPQIKNGDEKLLTA